MRKHQNITMLSERLKHAVCISYREVKFIPYKKDCFGYHTKLHLMVKLQFLGSVEYTFITITLRSTLTWSDSTNQSLVYRSNRSN